MIRQIDLFDPNHVYAHQAIQLTDDISLTHEHILKAGGDIYIEKYGVMAVQSAACYQKVLIHPSFYHSHHHPRGLVLTVYGMSDALSSMGISWETI